MGFTTVTTRLSRRTADLPVEGALIRAHRKTLRLSLRELGLMVGISGSRISAVETGVNSARDRISPRPETYARLAVALGMTEQQWLDEAAGPHTPVVRRRLRAIAAEMHLLLVATSRPNPDALTVNQVIPLMARVRGMCTEATFRAALHYHGYSPSPKPPQRTIGRRAS